jgi:2-polyprenyl-3-methyl-5-hydroxy-6-metoxy-1,4-benzoquinol methylase
VIGAAGLRDLTVREPGLVERMDGDCDERVLFATYRRFAVVNRIVSGWRGLYRRQIRPVLRAAAADGRTPRLVDLGFGGGDIPRALGRWSRADGLPVCVVAADIDPRAARYAREVDRGGVVQYRTVSSTELAAEGRRFDVVLSNHLLHHLDQQALSRILADSGRLARSLVLHADIARSRAAYGLYAVGSVALAAGSYVREDGLLSIRRSYTPAELRDVAAQLGEPGWQVAAYAPFRLALQWSASDDRG